MFSFFTNDWDKKSSNGFNPYTQKPTHETGSLFATKKDEDLTPQQRALKYQAQNVQVFHERARRARHAHLVGDDIPWYRRLMGDKPPLHDVPLEQRADVLRAVDQGLQNISPDPNHTMTPEETLEAIALDNKTWDLNVIFFQSFGLYWVEQIQDALWALLGVTVPLIVCKILFVLICKFLANHPDFLPKVAKKAGNLFKNLVIFIWNKTIGKTAQGQKKAKEAGINFGRALLVDKKETPKTIMTEAMKAAVRAGASQKTATEVAMALIPQLGLTPEDIQNYKSLALTLAPQLVNEHAEVMEQFENTTEGLEQKKTKNLAMGVADELIKENAEPETIFSEAFRVAFALGATEETAMEIAMEILSKLNISSELDSKRYSTFIAEQIPLIQKELEDNPKITDAIRTKFAPPKTLKRSRALETKGELETRQAMPPALRIHNALDSFTEYSAPYEKQYGQRWSMPYLFERDPSARDWERFLQEKLTARLARYNTDPESEKLKTQRLKHAIDITHSPFYDAKFFKQDTEEFAGYGKLKKSIKKRRGWLKKGSQAAKAYMAKLRALRRH